MKIVKQVTGKPVRFGGHKHEGWLPANATMPEATPVKNTLLTARIIDVEGGYILEWESQSGSHLGDTWHQSVADAENQAKIEFGIEAWEWENGEGDA
jgi:hypothetical protein